MESKGMFGLSDSFPLTDSKITTILNETPIIIDRGGVHTTPTQNNDFRKNADKSPTPPADPGLQSIAPILLAFLVVAGGWLVMRK